jgi:tryptophanyl-tRNA synthetase
MLKGANLDVDISYQYLRVFLDSDEDLKSIEEEYGSGRMLTGPVKAKLIGVLTKLVLEHQERRGLVTEEVLASFQEIRERSL